MLMKLEIKLFNVYRFGNIKSSVLLLSTLSQGEKGGINSKHPNIANACYLLQDIILVEGLKLDDILPGIYSVHCLPLRLLGAEGSPTRCILIKWYIFLVSPVFCNCFHYWKQSMRFTLMAWNCYCRLNFCKCYTLNCFLC